VIAAAAAGYHDAWDALVERYAQQVWDTARSFGLDSAGAAAISDQVWRRLLGHLKELRTDAELRAWLRVAAEREACSASYLDWLTGKAVQVDPERSRQSATRARSRQSSSARTVP
jgi:DNA-directed RNA polymerase specialized sigma24 family protein